MSNRMSEITGALTLDGSPALDESQTGEMPK